jgi:hypothetical protein
LILPILGSELPKDFPMNQPLQTTAPANGLEAAPTTETPSLKVAFFGFVTSTTLACTVMVLLSSI